MPIIPRKQFCQTAAMQRRAKQTDFPETVICSACAECPYNSRCFDHRRQLCWSLGKLEHISKKYNCISVSDVEQQLPACRRPQHMSERFNHSYSLLLAEKAGSIRMNEMRDFLGEQLSSMQDMLIDLSFRVGQVRNIDAALSEQVKSGFEALGYPNAKTCAFVDENMCQRVEVYLSAQFSGDLVSLTSMVSSAVGCDLQRFVQQRVLGRHIRHL